MNVEARRIDRNTFDLFFGNQWSSWTRVRCGRNGLYRIAGEKVDHATLRELEGMVAHDMPITYGQSVQRTFHNWNAYRTLRLQDEIAWQSRKQATRH